MTEREIIMQTIAHKETGFVPTNIEITAQFGTKLEEKGGKGNIDVALNNHMLRKKYKRNTVLENGDQLDLFGVTWQSSKDGGDVGIVKIYPLEHCEPEEYKFPEINKELAVYVITENASSDEEYFKQKGFYGTLSLPIDPMLLEKTIMNHLPKEMMETPDKKQKTEDANV